MPRVRKILRKPADGRNYYLVDANFLANKHIPIALAPAGREQDRLSACQKWWEEIESQLRDGFSRVYVPDVCIAEAFKVLAKKYYEDKWFTTPLEFKKARDSMSRDLQMPSKQLKELNRKVKYHDISTNRDIVIGLDRFFEIFFKHKKSVSIPDLILVATAKYLMEFYDIPKDRLHIVTLDHPLREGIAKVQELPSAYDPTLRGHRTEVVFT